MEYFPLAPMSGLIRGLTWGLFALPAGFLAAAAMGSQRGLLVPAGILAILYLWVWLRMRPAGFRIGPRGLSLEWPARRREVPADDIAQVRTLGSAAVKAELGLAIRIGVGGLFGGFGWLWSRKRGLVDFYISRTDGFVWIERRRGRPLLITPVDPEAFASALRQASGRF